MFYQHQILNLEETVQERRIKENTLFEDSDNSFLGRSQGFKNADTKRPTTLLELKIHLESLITQIQLMAHIVLTPYKALAEYDQKMLEQAEKDINRSVEMKGKLFLTISLT